MPGWTPEVWGNFTPAGIAIFVVVFFVVALIRGWVVIGRYHNEVVEGYKQAQDKADARAVKDAETIGTLTQAITEKNATEETATKLLEAFRKAAAGPS